jgi:hypothetical protein
MHRAERKGGLRFAQSFSARRRFRTALSPAEAKAPRYERAGDNVRRAIKYARRKLGLGVLPHENPDCLSCADNQAQVL